jgi:hypothetical protein
MKPYSGKIKGERMKSYLIALISLSCLMILSCAKKTREAEQIESKDEAEYTLVNDAKTLSAYEGKKVCVKGKISNTPWQHLVASPDSFPIPTYFDVGDYQIMVYSKKELACPDCECEIEIKGTVLKVQSAGKHPKADEVLTEYHITADSWTCLDEKK